MVAQRLLSTGASFVPQAGSLTPRKANAMMASPNGSFINTSNTSEAPSITATVKRRISSKSGETPLLCEGAYKEGREERRGGRRGGREGGEEEGGEEGGREGDEEGGREGGEEGDWMRGEEKREGEEREGRRERKW